MSEITGKRFFCLDTVRIWFCLIGFAMSTLAVSLSLYLYFNQRNFYFDNAIDLILYIWLVAILMCLGVITIIESASILIRKKGVGLDDWESGAKSFCIVWIVGLGFCWLFGYLVFLN